MDPLGWTSQRAQVLTTLAREAFLRGATWVMPLEADAFWTCDGYIADILGDSPHGALACGATSVVSRATPQLRFHSDGRLSGFAGTIAITRGLSKRHGFPGQASGLDDGAALGRRRHRDESGLGERPALPPDSGARAQLLSQAESVRGWLGADEAELLLRATERAVMVCGSEAALVEIGSYCGKSTIVIAGCLSILGVNAALHAIDPHEGLLGASDSEIGVGVLSGSFDEFAANMSRAGLTDFVIPILSRSFDVEWSRAISLLFIDGLHDLASVRGDGSRFVPWVVQGGLVAFHDYAPFFPGVMQYVEELEASGAFRRVECASTLIVLERCGTTRHGWVTDPRQSEADRCSELPWFGPTRETPYGDGTPDDTLGRHVAIANLFAMHERARIRGADIDARLTATLEHLTSAQHDRRVQAEQAARRAAILEALGGKVREARHLEGTLRKEIDRHGRLLSRAEHELAEARAVADGLQAEFTRGTEAQAALVDELTEARAALSYEHGRRTFEVAALRTSLAASEARVAALLDSASWRVTAPVRAAYDVCLAIGHAVRKALPTIAPPEGDTRRFGVHGTGHEQAEAVSTPPMPTGLLVITEGVPMPDKDAGSDRLARVLTLLRRMGHPVTLVSDVEDARDSYAAALRSQGIDIVFGEAAALAHLARDAARYHTVLISRPDPALKYLFAVRAHMSGAKVVYDTVDLHWIRMSRAGRLTGDNETLARAEHYRRVEWLAIQGSDVTLTVTETERDTLIALDPALRVGVLPTIHAVEPLPTPWEDREGLLFIGSFLHTPNVDAMHHFITDVLPLVRRHLPDVVLTIIGSDLPQGIRDLASPAVRPVGHVADVRPYFGAARLLVCPIRFGAGMRGRIGHAMGHGLPVVTTALGAEGMSLADGETVLVADGPVAFSSAVVRLYNDRALWTHLAANGVAHVETTLSERVAAERLEALFPSPPSTPSLHDAREAREA